MDAETILTSRIFHVQRVKYDTAGGINVTKDIVRHPGSVAIVPLLADSRVCLIRNHRVSVGRTLIEIPAGTLEPPEAPLACAFRELTEETGYTAETMDVMTTFFPAPGILDEMMHLFLARNLSAGEPQREPGEEIENLVVTLEQALDMIRSGEICDAKSIVGLLLIDQQLRLGFIEP